MRLQFWTPDLFLSNRRDVIRVINLRSCLQTHTIYWNMSLVLPVLSDRSTTNPPLWIHMEILKILFLRWGTWEPSHYLTVGVTPNLPRCDRREGGIRRREMETRCVREGVDDTCEIEVSPSSETWKRVHPLCSGCEKYLNIRTDGVKWIRN